MKKTVALIFGGEGYEREISALSAENLSSMIDRELYDVLHIHIDKNGGWYIYSSPCEEYIRSDSVNITETFPVRLGEKSGFISNGRVIPVSCAIPCLHGDFGEDGTVQGALTLARIKYVGQDVYASAITSDKAYTKLAAEHLGIPVAKWIISANEDKNSAKKRAEAEIGYPMFIKPARLGSSYGAHPVYSEKDFDAAFLDAERYDPRLLIEELVPVEYELECALFDNGKRMLSPGGRVLSGGSFYDFKAKYKGYDSPKTEAKTGAFPEIEKKVCEYADALAELIGIKHLARLDFFVTKDGNIYFNEINAFPGMTSTSLYPKLTEDMGLESGDFINLLIAKVCSDDRRI